MEATKVGPKNSSEGASLTVSAALSIHPLMGVYALDHGEDRHPAVALYFASFLDKVDRMISAGVPGVEFLFPSIDQEEGFIAVQSHTRIKVSSDTELAQAGIRFQECPTAEDEGYDVLRENEVDRLLKQALEDHLTEILRAVGFSFSLKADDCGVTLTRSGDDA